MCVCVCVDGMNLKAALRWHIHKSVHSVLRQCYTQAHTLKPFEESEPTGLKVDIAAPIGCDAAKVAPDIWDCHICGLCHI